MGVTASYAGDANDGPSTSSQYFQPVSVAATTVSVSSSTVHRPFNGTGCATTAMDTGVTCSSLSDVGVGASVTDADGAVPTDTTVATASHGSLTLSNAATLTETGDVLTFLNDPNASLSSARPETFTATIALASPATGVPSGTVTWTITGADGSVVDCATGITVGVDKKTLVEQCRVPQGVLVASGSPYTVSAAYSGDESYAGSSSTFSQVVNPASTRTFVAGTREPVYPGASESFTASVVPSIFGNPPTGSVTFAFTALPFKVGGCTLSTSGPGATCAPGSLTGVVDGYDVSDVSDPGAIQPGTTVVGLHAGSASLSSTPTSNLAGQQLLFMPAGAGVPVVNCAAGDTFTYVQTGTVCTVSAANGFAAGAVWGLVVSYSGDPSDAVSSSHQLKLTIQ